MPGNIVTSKPDRSVLVPLLKWYFWCWNFHLKGEYGARCESNFSCYSHCYVTWCPWTTGIVASQWRLKRRCARDTLPHTYDIGMFQCSKNNSTTIKHIYDESGNSINCQLWCCFWQKWLVESPINGGNDWHGECADTRSPSLHSQKFTQSCCGM